VFGGARVKKVLSMRVGRAVVSRIVSVTATAVLITVCAVSLSACSIPVSDLPLIGLPANAPPRTDNPPAYLPVHDVPPPRDEEVLTTDQQKKLQTELLTKRDKQTSEANALAKSTPTDTPPKPKKPANSQQQ
jgi:hypothetical protein